MIKKHERNTLIGTVSNEQFEMFFSDCMMVISKLDSLYESLGSFINGEMDEDEIFDELDDLVIKTDMIDFVSTSFASLTDAYNKYLRNTNYTLQIFVENVSNLTDKGTYPSLGDADILRSGIFSIIGGLTYFLVSDFDVDVTALQFKESDGSKFTIDEIFNAYVEKAGGRSEIQTIALYLLDKFKEYKLHLDFFDEYPELQEEFEAIAGPEYVLISDGMLTLDFVNAVLAGTEVVSSLFQYEDDE